MSFSPEMTHLILEIRKQVSPDTRSKIKFTNENLIKELVDLYLISSDENLRVKIKRVIDLANGEPLAVTTSTPLKANEAKTKRGKKMYRGRMISD